MKKILGNLIREGALFGVTVLLLWAGYIGTRERRKNRHGERSECVRELVKMVEDMIPEGRGQDFDAAKWTARWLEIPQPALAGAAPKDYLDTAEGRAVVRRLLGAVESGAYV